MSIFPAITQSAWLIHKNELGKQRPSAIDRNFRNHMYRLNYYQDSGAKHRAPGFFLHMFSWFIRVVPKIGPLRSLKIKAPGTAADSMFLKSFETVRTHFNSSLPAMHASLLPLVNKNLDDGEDSHVTEYNLTDQTYAALLLKLKKTHFKNMNRALQENILEFFSDASKEIILDGRERKVAKVLVSISEIQLVSN